MNHVHVQAQVFANKMDVDFLLHLLKKEVTLDEVVFQFVHHKLRLNYPKQEVDNQCEKIILWVTEKNIQNKNRTEEKTICIGKITIKRTN